MADATTSQIAMAVAMPPVSVREIDHVELRMLYDCFRPDTVEVHELEHRDDATLADYLKGLPEDQEWMVFFNGTEIELDQDTAMLPVAKGDRIGLILLPQGGGGLKSVLRIALQAAAIAAAFIPGVGWAAALAINVAIGLVNAFLLTPKPPKNNSQEEGRSYGIDGAKNSATEGIPYPVTYGMFRVAGNFSDTYTENVGDDQYLYLRTVLNDGLIDSVTGIEINEQPIDNFTDVQHNIRLGSLEEEVNPWFGRSIVQKNKGIKLGTGWTTHITTQEVDMVRFDVTFPTGLVNIDKKKGTYKSRSVGFEAQYRRVDPVTRQPIGNGAWSSLPSTQPYFDYTRADFSDFAFGGLLAKGGELIMQAQAAALDASPHTAGQPAVEIRKVGTDQWVTAGEFSTFDDTGAGYVFDEAGDGSVAGNTNITPQVTETFTVPVSDGEYQVRGVNGATVTKASNYPSSGTSSWMVSDSRTRQIRRSFDSLRLERGYYEVAIRRTSETATGQYEMDEVYLTDVSEIEMDQVALRGTANLSLRIKLNEQLSNIPSLSCLVKGCVLQEYDIDGNPTVKRWSANPAWIGLDILVGAARGAGFPLSRIDWPSWIAFAKYCDDNNITFNGVFDTASNIGDALNMVLRIGHAAPVPFGTKVSVAIDRKRDPVTVFNSTSIIKGTFQVTYLSMQDRANEYEVTYYDKMDRNKAKTLRYVDPKAVTFNEMPRKASVTLTGVDNAEQAKVELWRMIYANRLLIRSLSFDTWMESINLTQGEVALIQHSLMEWADDGRLKPGSTATQINLDKKVEMDGTSPYSVLVHFSALPRLVTEVSQVIGTKLLLAHNPVLDDPLVTSKIARVTNEAGVDLEVVSVTPGDTYDTVQLAAPASGISSGQTITLWQTDAVEERGVSGLIQNPDGTTTVQLASALPDAPGALSSYVFGKVSMVRKPYVLTGVTGNGIEKRKLTFVEYHEGVYAEPELEIPIPVTRVSDRQVAHVRGVLFDYQQLVETGRRVVNARIHWDSSGTINYGGADVYMSINGEAYRSAGSALGVSEFHIQLAPDDVVDFKVVAYNQRGDRASLTNAPTVKGSIDVEFASLDPVTSLACSTVAFQVDGKVQFSWTPPADATGIEGYEVQYRRSIDTAWTSLGTFNSGPVEAAGLPTGNYVGRVRAIAQTSSSVWVEKAFTVVVAPGSIMANWTTSNDRNGDPIAAPRLPATQAIEHTLNKDGSANISFEWEWDGDDADIDGFIVEVEQTGPA